jgi:hypothetical protein
VRVVATGVSAALGDGTRNLVTLTGGEALFVLSSAGVAGRATGTVALTGVPGVSLSGTVALEVNNGAAVDDTFVVDGVARVLKVDAGTVAVPRVQVRGTGVTLTVAGQALRGDVSFTRDGSTVRVSIANGVLSLGTPASPLVRATGVAGTFTLVGPRVVGSVDEGSGLHGWVTATVAVDVPGVAFGSQLRLEVNTTGATQDSIAPGLRLRTVGTTTATLTVAGQTLTARFTLERRVTAAGEVVVLASFSQLTASLGGLVSITGGGGALLVTTRGVAASLTRLDVTFATVGGVTIDSGVVEVRVNTSAAPVDVTVAQPAGDPLVLSVPGGPVPRGLGHRRRPEGRHAVVQRQLHPEQQRQDQLRARRRRDRRPRQLRGDGAGPRRRQRRRPGRPAGGHRDRGPTVPGQPAGRRRDARGHVQPDRGRDVLPLGQRATRAVALADLDGDGRLDVLVLRDGVSAVYRLTTVHSTTGAVTFTAGPTLATTGATSVAVGDVDGDGRADVVVGGTTTWLFRNAGGTGASWAGLLAAATVAGAGSATGLALADLDNDGRRDLVVVRSTGDHAVYRNPGGTWTGFGSPTFALTASAARAVAVGDLDGNGYADVVIAADGAPSVVHLNKGPGPVATGHWGGLEQTGAALPGSRTDGRAVAVGDVDGDGRLDVVLGGAGGAPQLFLNRGSAGVTLAAPLAASGATTARLVSVAGCPPAAPCWSGPSASRTPPSTSRPATSPSVPADRSRALTPPAPPGASGSGCAPGRPWRRARRPAPCSRSGTSTTTPTSTSCSGAPARASRSTPRSRSPSSDWPG